MAFANALDADSQLLVLGFMERESLDAIQLTCQYLYDVVERSTSLPLRQLECLRVEGNDASTRQGPMPLTVTVERNGEREVMEADSTCVTVRHFFAYLRNSYCGEIGIAHVELSSEFIDRLLAMHNRFKTSAFVMIPVRFTDVSSADLQRLNSCLGPGLARFACGSNNIAPEHVTDQLMDSLASKGVKEAVFFSIDQSAYFDVSDEVILRFCFCSGRSEARRLVLDDARVTQRLFDRLLEAHRDSSNSVDVDLILRDPGMPKIDYAGHTERDENEYETTHTFASNGWTMEVRVDKHGYFSVCRFKAGSQHSCRCPMRVPEIPTKKRRIL